MRARIGLWLLACLSAGTGFGQPSRLKLPDPPQQRTRWRAPAGVPTNVLSAAETLFAQGFPDPRGCEYRELEIQVGTLWGGNSNFVKTCGWVLPSKSSSAQHFAICWNGLIYTVTDVGPPSNLHGEATNSSPPTYKSYFGRAVEESAAVVFKTAMSTRRLLLLRSGETAAAVENWSPKQHTFIVPSAEMEALGRDKVKDYDPYLELASDWAWALFDRMICAHMRGDEALALADARKLTEVQPRIEAEAARRGFPRPPSYRAGMQSRDKPYLDFLGQLPEIRADLERRAREGHRVSVIQTGLTNLPSQSARIAALVRDLELVHARQWGQPGWVNLAEDPIVQALIHEGDAAMEPLLDCLQTDKRLTRSVGFGRSFHRGRTVVSVASAAWVAAQAILQADFGHNAAAMRAYWNKYKGLALEERWYAILKDDSAGMGRWLEAAGNIVQPVNVTTYPGTGFSEGHPAPTNTPARLRGDPLRGRSNPSVTELLVRRATEISPTNSAAYSLSDACQLGLRLGTWDPPAALPVAKVLMDRCLTVTQYSQQQDPQVIVAKLAMFRAGNGDSSALADYGAWLQTTTPKQLEHSLPDALAPLCAFATNAALQATAERLFSDTNSAWSRLPWKVSGSYNPPESGLVNLPAFRRLLSRELDRKEQRGSVEYRQGNAHYQITNYWGGTFKVAWPDAERPADGTRTDLRWCDWIAWSLSSRTGAPPFNPFASRDQRDEAIARAKTWLEQQ